MWLDLTMTLTSDNTESNNIPGEHHPRNPPWPSHFISICRRPIWNLSFADDIDLIAGTDRELQDLTYQQTDRSTAYLMKTSPDNSKMMAIADGKVDIDRNLILIEKVSSFKHLGANMSKDGGSMTDMCNRIAAATLAVAWQDVTLPVAVRYSCVCLSICANLWFAPIVKANLSHDFLSTQWCVCL